MTSIQLIACLGLIVGLFLAFRIHPMEFTDGLFGFLAKEPKNIRNDIHNATKRKKVKFLKKAIMEAQEVLKMTGREKHFSVICAVSLILFMVGASVSIMIGNFFLAPVMAVGFMFFPFWYVVLSASNWKKNVAAELETALSVITTAYLRTEDILTAVEENVQYLNPPVQRVFQDFIMRINLVNPDVHGALKELRKKIDNDVFQEWCDALSDCQYDRSLKTTLTPIVTKLSDIRIVNAELEYLIVEPRKEFITMVIFVIGNIPLLYFLNKSWYDTLMHTAMGQVILAFTAAVIFVSTAVVVRLTKPIEYRR
ncbi:type II secretion system F family protein [[Clostridium] symbiosum]|uniref:type II secretion system F family protein n=1 Tax=Clostridium symbiosum TaxID=1512 RepID=UPI001AA1ACC9|nr:hypothetical protein [[Clostridium] symbiosum]MBO1695238.1 hypothetical protein [[Clostridium] symbiosum]